MSEYHLNVFGQPPASSTSTEIMTGGGITADEVDVKVESGLKRTYLKSFGDDTGNSKGFKLYKPDTEDLGNPDFVNPDMKNFGPEFQLRDLKVAEKAGLVLTKPDEDSLVLAIGGDSTFTKPAEVVVRPELTAVYRAGNDYGPLYDAEVEFFALSDEIVAGGVPGSVALVSKHEDGVYRSHFKLLLRFKQLSGNDDDVLNPPTYSDTLLVNNFEVLSLRGYQSSHQGKIHAELRRKSDDELVSNDEDQGYITVSDLLNVNNYVKLYHEEVILKYDLDDGRGEAELDVEYTYDVWVADQTLTPSTAITVDQQLGPSLLALGDPRPLQWGTLPKQVYDIELALQELTGETVAAVQAQEDEQNRRLGEAEARIVELEKEAGVAATGNPVIEAVAPTGGNQFPNVRLFQRLQYLDSLLRGSEGPFSETNIFFSDAVFSLPETTIPKLVTGQNGPQDTLVTAAPLIAGTLPTKGALTLLWTEILPQIQKLKNQLTTFPSYSVLWRYFSVGDIVVQSEPLSGLAYRARAAFSDTTIKSNLAYYRPHASHSGQVVLTLLHEVEPGVVTTETFTLERARQLLPPGFRLMEFREGEYHEVPILYNDPTLNSVDHAYIPANDIYAKLTEPNHFIQFVPYENPTIPGQMVNQLYNLVYFALEVHTTVLVPDEERALPIDLDVRGELRKLDARIDELARVPEATFSALRGLHDRLSRIEHWREAF